jgi:hypothetical protein
VFSFFLRKVFSKNIDHKLELILTLCFHSHLNSSQEKSTLPKKIPGSLPLKHGISYRGTYLVAQSKGPTMRTKALLLSQSKQEKRTEGVITIQRGKDFWNQRPQTSGSLNPPLTLAYLYVCTHPCLFVVFQKKGDRVRVTIVPNLACGCWTADLLRCVYRAASAPL